MEHGASQQQTASDRLRSLFRAVRDIDPRILDAAVAVSLAVVALGTVIGRPEPEADFRSDDLLGAVLVFLQTAPLAFRRTSAAGVLLITTGALVAHSALGYEVVQAGTLGSLVAVYGAAYAASTGRASFIVAAVTIAGLGAFFATNRGEYGLTDFVATTGTWAVAWFAGTFMRLKATLVEQSERRTSDLQTILDLSGAVTSTLDLPQLYETALDRLADLIPYTGAAIQIDEGSGPRQVATRRPAGLQEEPPVRLPGWTATSIVAELSAGKPVIIADIRGDNPRAVEYREAVGGDLDATPLRYFRSWMSVPLTVKGRVIGNIGLVHENPGSFRPEHVELAQTVANHVAIAIDNARLLKDREQKAADLQAMLDMSKVVTSTLDLQALLEGALDQLKLLIPYSGASLEVDTDSGEMLVASRRPDSVPTGRIERHPTWRRSSMIRDLRSGRVVLIGDIRGDEPRAVEYRDALVRPIEETSLNFVRSLLAAPLIAKSGVIGNLVVTHSEPGFFTAGHAELAGTIANHFALAIENARLYDQAQRKTGELEGLLQAGERMHESLALPDVFEALVEAAAEGLGLHFASVMLREGAGARLRVVASRGFEAAPDQAGREISGLPQQPAEGGVAWVVDDAAASQDDVNQELTVALGMRSFVQIPIAYRDAAGVFMVGYREPHKWTPDEVRLYQSLAQRAKLAIENAVLFEETQSRAREMEALYRADEKLFSSLDLDEVLMTLADIAVDVLGADKSLVSIAEAGTHEFAPKAWRNLSEETLAYYREVRRTRSPQLYAGEIVAAEDAAAANPEMSALFEREGMAATLDVPIVFEGRVSGAFGLAWSRRHHFTAEEKRLGLALAQRAAVAIDNARLFARAQQAASLEERQRLARELHDSVSQALYGIALGARTARTQLERDPARVAEPLDYVLSLAEAGLAEMRALIFELRPESLETEGLVAALEKQVAAARARHGLKVTAELGPEPAMGLDVKEAAYRIAQEALNNVAKHAQATSVLVRLEADHEAVVLTVQDDGRGFDPAGHFPGHMGLHSMRERAAKVGAKITIEAAPGRGATVRVKFPAL